MNTKSNKASILILEGIHKDKEILLQFNPVDYAINKSNNFETKKLIGMQDFITQFKGGEEKDLSLELLFDSTDTGEDVRDLIKPLAMITDIDPELHAPPPCQFVWAGSILKGVVTQLNKKFVFFYQNGTPARVKVTLTLKPYKTLKEIEAQTIKHSSDLTKKRILKGGDDIWLLSYREYGDSSYWRLIARHNNINDPLNIENGKQLFLPPKE